MRSCSAIFGTALVLSLVFPASAQETPNRAAAPQPKLIETLDAKAGVAVYAVSPKLHTTPPQGRLPTTVTSFGGVRSLDGRQRTYQARIEITHNFSNKQQYFGSVTLRDGTKAVTKYAGVDKRCYQAFSCEFTEAVSATLPEAALKAAASAGRPLGLRVKGNDSYVIVSIPAAYVTALLAKMEGARVSSGSQ